MPPSSTSLENQEQSPEINAINLREEYRRIVEQRAQEKSLLPKDKEACLAWLNQFQESHDPEALRQRIDHLKSNKVQGKIQEQRERYLKELDLRVKSGLVREETAEERLNWFLNELSFQEREAILRTKDGKKDDLFNKEREKIFNDFKKVFAYFGHIPLYKNFIGLKLADRKMLVKDLQTKKTHLESGVLPTIVREKLKTQCVEMNVDTCKNLVEEAQKKHAQLKDRFRRLPGPVQKEHLEEFKAALLPERQRLLREIEGKIKMYKNLYSRKIKTKQTSGVNGLNLFSHVSENVPGSSAYRYMHEWFLSKLSLKEMAEAIERDDLDKPERETLHQDMRKILKKLPPRDQASLRERFNKADLEGRRRIVREYAAAHPEKTGVAKKIKDWIIDRIKNILFSSKHATVEEAREAYAIGEVVAEQRRRYQISHHDHADVDNRKNRDRKKPIEILQKTARFEKTIHSERLRGPDGKVEIDLNRLKTYREDRKGLLRALKPTVYDPNAKLADTFRLRRRSRELVHGDIQKGYRDELAWARGELRESVGNVLEAEVLTESLYVDKKEMQQVLEQTDWKSLGKEVISKTAA